MHTEHDLPWLAEPLRTLRDDQTGHALIVHGGMGSGLLALVLRAAQAWLCERPPGPCGQCASCQLVQAHTHPDLKVLMPETWQHRLNWGQPEAEGGGEADGDSRSKKKPSREIKVEAVRQAIDWAHTSSGRNRGKVLVIFPADAMNTVSANALLKTLEEPGQGVRLLLAVQDPAQLLPTILSRCQRLRLSPPDEAQALRWLQAQGLQDAAQLLRAASGEPLAAIELAGQGVSGASWADLPRQVARGDGHQLASWPVPQALQTLQQLCHDWMTVACGGAPRFFPPESLPKGADLAALVAWSQELARVRRHDEHPWQAPLLLEALLAQAQALFSGAPKATARRYT